MNIAPFDLRSLEEALSNTLDPMFASNRRKAEESLSSMESGPGFAPGLLNIVFKPNDMAIKMAAALYFKNYIKRHYQDMPLTDRHQVKQSVVELMAISPSPIQRQLSEAISIIAESDFPAEWDNLLQSLISKLSLENLEQSVGVLQTAHAIFKRWRSQVENNDLYREINYVMQEFAPAYLEFFKAVDACVDQSSKNLQPLQVLLEIVLLLTKIFYSLNSQDLPGFFEDHMVEFMGLFQKYIHYTNPILPEDKYYAGVVEKLKSMICETIDLYATRYEADFPMLPEFIQIIWALLTSPIADPKNDVLVSKAMAFLTTVVRHERHRKIFDNPSALASICAQIVLPNMTIRDLEIELLQSDPMEYLRMDLDGAGF
jgi:exportin-2 (importin alpha re-exporter)